MLGFADGLAWLAQIGLFVLLGLLASPARLPAARCCRRWSSALRAGPAGPPAVGAASSADAGSGVGWRDQAFLSWAGLRGAVPIVLATIPLSPAAGRDRLFDVVFVLVVVFTLVQASTLAAGRPLARGHRAGRGRPSCGWRPRRWSGCGPTCCSWRSRGLAAGRRAHRRAAAAGRARSVTLVLRDGAGSCPAPRHPAADRRQPADRGDRRGPRRGRAPAAGGEPARPAGPLVRRDRARTGDRLGESSVGLSRR